MRGRIVPDRKLAARNAACGKSDSVPLGAFLDVLSQNEHTGRRAPAVQEEVRGRPTLPHCCCCWSCCSCCCLLMHACMHA